MFLFNFLSNYIKKLLKGLSQGSRRYFLGTFLNFHQFYNTANGARESLKTNVILSDEGSNANGKRKKQKHFCENYKVKHAKNTGRAHSTTQPDLITRYQLEQSPWEQDDNVTS